MRATVLPGGEEEIDEGLLKAILEQTGLTKQDLAEIKAKRLGREEYLRRGSTQIRVPGKLD